MTVMKEDFWGNRNILAKIQPSELFAETYAIAAHQVLGVSVMTDEGATVLFFHMGSSSPPRRSRTSCRGRCCAICCKSSPRKIYSSMPN